MGYKKISLIFSNESDLDDFHTQLKMVWKKDKTVKNIKLSRTPSDIPSVWTKDRYELDADVKTSSARDYCLAARSFNGSQKFIWEK